MNDKPDQGTIDAHYPLMLADTMARGTGSQYYHAHDHDARGGGGKALCGRVPGKHGYWGYYFGSVVTCPKCNTILRKGENNGEH